LALHFDKIESLTKISIEQIVETGWSKQLGQLTVRLEHDESGIILLINDIQQPVCWQIYERQIRGRLQRGGFIPADSAAYYVISNGKRYRHLLISKDLRIGTQGDFGATWTSRCWSRRKRNTAKECRFIGVASSVAATKAPVRDYRQISRLQVPSECRRQDLQMRFLAVFLH
jgi:hypothetical protein